MSQAPVNKYGIENTEALSVLEYAIVEKRQKEVLSGEKQLKNNGFNAEHLKEIHHHLFSDVYDWAGKPRNIISKKDYKEENGQRCRTTFCHPDKFSEAFLETSKFLFKTDNLKKISDRNSFVKAFTAVQIQLNAIHPFPDGNGRALQVFMQQLANGAGYTVDYSKVSQKDWILANGHASPNQVKFFGHEYIEKTPSTQMLSEVFDKIISVEKNITLSNSVNQKKTYQTTTIVKSKSKTKSEPER